MEIIGGMCPANYTKCANNGAQAKKKRAATQAKKPAAKGRRLSDCL
jgi:hypothetical protein